MAKYASYTDIFFFNLAIMLLKNIVIIIYVIKLIEGKQLFYKPIYTFNLVKLMILKTYIKTYLKTKFIPSSKSLANMSIFFIKCLILVLIYVIIIEVSIIWLAIMGIYNLWLTCSLTCWARPNNLYSWTWLVCIIRWESKKGTNEKLFFAIYIVILNTRFCLSIYLIYHLVSRITLIRSWLRSSTFL